MNPRIDPSPALRQLAALQEGVLTSEQASAYGLGRHSIGRLLDAGQWQRLDRGLYLTSNQQPSWLALAWAGTLIGGDHARIARTGAAYLHTLSSAPPDLIHVLVPEHRVVAPRQSWVFERERPGVRSAASMGGPPRTTVAETVLDLCQDADSEQVVGWVSTALQTRLTSSASLRRALAGRRRFRHRRLVEELLTDVDEGAETALELAYLRDVERAHGLPRGDRQQSRDRSPDRRDVVYKEFQLVVELDGRLGHTGNGRFRDMRRDNAAVLAGETTLRYGWGDVTGQPCAVTWQVEGVLQHRGWADAASSCRRCRRHPRYA